MNKVVSRVCTMLAAVVVTGLIPSIVLLAGCSQSVSPSSTTSVGAGLGQAAGHAIHVFSKRADGTTKQLNFGPATEVVFSPAATSTTAPTTPPIATVPVSNPGFGDGGTELVGPDTVESPGTNPESTAWVLVSRAAEQCGYNNLTIPPWHRTFGGYAWYLYVDGQDGENTAQNCAERLEFEQNLVCIADKLAQIADAVGTVVWPALAPGQGPAQEYEAGTDPDLGDWYAEWDIPPQADSDRFIVRDLAIHTLAMVPTVDAFTDIAFPASMLPAAQKETCAQAFAWLANPTNTQSSGQGCIPSNISVPMFGESASASNNFVPAFPPSASPICGAIGGVNNASSIAQTAVDLDAQIVRASGRLLHDVIRRDVYSDMAAAAQQSAQALDPVLGNEYAWGQADAGLYGTVAHAARVLVGRWEIGGQADFGSVADPQCEGTTELNLVPSAFGAELSARVLDRPIRTAGEQTAVQLVERSGIVLPSCSIPTGSAQSLGQALALQLTAQEAAQNGLAVPQAPSAALSAVVAPLADDEIIFAFQRALRTWRLMTDTADTTADGGSCNGPVAVPTSGGSLPPGSIGALPAGLFAAPVVSALSSFNAIVVQGGLSRSRLATDPMARAGGMTEASQCGDSNSYWTEWGVDGTATMINTTGGNPDLITPPPMAALPPGVFQDAFHIGQAMERRLNVIQAATQNLSFQDPANQAKGGIAELRSWAGSTTVHAWVQTIPLRIGAAGGGAGTELEVQVAGMNYQTDFYIPQQATYTAANLAPVQNAFGFVYGPPWVAECAAGLRPDCPANFTSTYVQLATGITDITSSFAPSTSTATGAAGVLDSVFQLTVPLSGGTATAFTPPLLPAATDTDAGVATVAPQESHLYMVRLHDPTSQAGQGRVLGTLPLRATWNTIHTTLTADIVGFVDAPMQRELVHDAIDLGKWVGAAPPALGDPSAAQTSGYCVDGVPRDLFVPLDNELVSGTQTYEDSWQAYISLAQQAAQTADTLGQQLIADDLQISENQQAAEEQLANICGDFGALSTATVGTDGTISAGAEDPTTAQCLSQPMTDVVFLGQLPATIPATGDQTAAIKNLICSPAPASASQLCQRATLTAAGLKVGNATAAKQTSTSSVLSGGCADLVNKVAPSFRSRISGPELLADLNDPLLSSSAMLTAAGQLSMVVGLDNSWKVFLGSQQIMDSTSSSFWPGCLSAGAGQCNTLPTAWQNSMSQAWSIVFRDCNDGNSPEEPLGCGGTSGTPTAELNTIKIRVAHAIWTIAMSAGTLAQGTFRGPIPAVFPANDFCAGNNCDAYFPTGNFTYYAGTVVPASTCQDPSQSCGTLTTADSVTSQVDVNGTGSIYAVAPGSPFGAFMPGAPFEIPYWYRRVYGADYLSSSLTSSDMTKHVLASNDAAIFNQCYLGGSCGTPGAGGATAPPQNPFPMSLASLVGRARGLLDGYSCPLNHGDFGGGPVPDTESQLPWWITVAVAEQGYDMETPSLPWQNGLFQYQWGANFFFCYSSSTCLFNAFNSSGWDPSAFNGYTGKEANFGTGSSFNPPAGAPSWPFDYAGATLPTSTWSTGARSTIFNGSSTAPDGTCGAAALIMQASVLACTPNATAVNLSTLSLSQPPSVANLTDIPVLEGWLQLASQSLNNVVGGLYAQDIPTQVVSDFQNGTVGSGAIGGTKGQAILAMEQQLQAIPTSWTQIASDLTAIQNAIQVANLAVTAANLQQQTTEGQLALQTIQTEAQETLAVDQFMQTVAAATGDAIDSWGQSLEVIGTAAMTLSDEQSSGSAELGAIQAEQATANQVEQNQLAQALAQLGGTTGPLWADVQKQINALRASVATIDASGQTIVQSQNEAAYQAAIGTGQDFVNIAGQEVPIPVDTVLRRQASATEQRYQAALTNAKALAYMARRAIEQRIGVTLDALTQQVGPLDPPASWADDICSLQGVNYASLSTATPATDADGGTIDGGGIGGSADLNAINQFADAWVGDYVAKLQNFVTYYNVQYPSHQGDDTAVLSLRYDLLPPTAQCTIQAPNLLVNSGDLSQFSSTSWQLAPCATDTGKCLEVVGGFALAGSQAGPWQGQANINTGISDDLPSFAVSGITWLSDVSASATTVAQDGGADDGGALEAGVTSNWPNNVVLQQVQLSAGAYVLSWWDQARCSDGTLPPCVNGPSPVPYLVEVFDASWNSVVTDNLAPYVAPAAGDGEAPSLWSSRHALSFTVATSGVYSVAFGASTLGQGYGNVAIAAVQLEQGTSGQPTDYVATGSSTMVQGLNCPMSDSDLRAGFTHNCDNTGACWYDLNVPLVIDTTQLTGTPDGTQLASGNYNYRHIDSAINLVGTNVHDCTNDPNPSCYGSAFVQYDLAHDATNAGIIGYDGNSRVFDFGIASINHGKALAAERYITMPISSNDQQLISQPGIQHIEFGGRPLDGTYHLRIWDSPDLNWPALQDIQIILDYEYWSQIQNGSTQQVRPLQHRRNKPIIKSLLNRR